MQRLVLLLFISKTSRNFNLTMRVRLLSFGVTLPHV